MKVGFDFLQKKTLAQSTFWYFHLTKGMFQSLDAPSYNATGSFDHDFSLELDTY